MKVKMDVTYTNGVIAVRETSLLKDKIIKLCEGSAEEAFRALSESGFGKGAEAFSVHEYEKLLSADESELDAFIREYAPTNAEREYLLTPRDFHNAKALVKAEYLKLSAEEIAPMLAPDGLVSAEEISKAIKSGNLSALDGELKSAVEEGLKLISNEEAEGEISGAEIGNIFDRALYKRLSKACSRNLFLKRCVATKADMTNILTALRSETAEYAASNYVCSGKLSAEKLSELFQEDAEKAAHALDNTAYKDFLKLCLAQKNSSRPMTDAEKLLDGYETDELAKHKFELKRAQPFLYYVFRRRAENANVRILFVCLLAGMNEQAIKNRLRAF